VSNKARALQAPPIKQQLFRLGCKVEPFFIQQIFLRIAANLSRGEFLSRLRTLGEIWHRAYLRQRPGQIQVARNSNEWQPKKSSNFLLKSNFTLSCPFPSFSAPANRKSAPLGRPVGS
jgi:hypothetical protein